MSASIRPSPTNCDGAPEPGADYLLSLTERNLAIAEETGARPVLIPAEHGDLTSLFRAAEQAQKRGLHAILDPVIDPVHFGFVELLSRYRDVRAHLPDAEMLMGTGNLTELTDADFGRRHGFAAWNLLRTRDHQRAHCPCKPPYAPHDRGA